MKDQIETNDKLITETQQEINKIEGPEKILYKKALIDNINNQKELDKQKLKDVIKKYNSSEVTFDHAKTFLSLASGFYSLSATPSNRPPITLFKEDDPEFMVLVKNLDSNCSLRRGFKIGVIFVDKGQTNQFNILRNENGSPKYNELLHHLGAVINEKDATRIFNNQIKMIYYATASYEIIYHVATLIPTDYKDEQQVVKKKYVGNDSVHIVWTENDRGYKAGTIKSAFNFVHLIVKAMRNGLYRVKVEFKKNPKKGVIIKFFGPLISGMILPMEILPAMLRFTSINARKRICFKNLQVLNPIYERRRTLGKIMTKYSVPIDSKTEPKEILLSKLMKMNL